MSTEQTLEFNGENYTPQSYAKMLIETAKIAIERGHYDDNTKPKAVAVHKAAQLHNWLIDAIPGAERFAIEVIKEIGKYKL